MNENSPTQSSVLTAEAIREESGSDFWARALGDAPALELPTDRPRPAVLGAEMGVESRALSEELCVRLRQLGEERGVGAATVVLGAFALMCNRYTAQERFVVGVEREGRLVAVPVDFSGRKACRKLLDQLSAALEAASDAGEVPSDLSERMGVDGDTSRHAIYQAAFGGGDSIPAPESRATEPGFDLHLELIDASGRGASALRLDYNEDLFEPATAVRMLGHIEQILAGVIEDAGRTASELPMLSERERHELLVERNQTAREFPQGCLPGYVEKFAAKTPDAIAVVCGRDQLSYGEFNARANQLAHYLRKRGVGRDVRVGICLNRSIDFAVALMAVLKAGATCVPLDPKYPAERLEFMLEDTAAPIVLTERGLLPQVPRDAAPVYVSEGRRNFGSEPRTNLSVGSAPEDIAYVIYTSGSTGRPRGVLLQHRGLVNYTLGAVEMFGLTSADRMLQFCSISFDAAIEEIFSTWAAGATLVFRDDEVSLEPSEFFARVAEQKITAVDLPTAYWHEWVYALEAMEEKVPASLRLVIVGGEKSKPEAFATWHKFVGQRVRWVNTYGPAEASVVATSYEPRAGESRSTLPIGRPVANARVYLLDADLNLVPVGVPGELHIAGVGVAAGYLNLPELTAQKFIRDIFSTDAAARMYKTGDLARHLPSGEIEFVGRRDHQVKIRGFRVEPGEIESVLARHAGVKEAAVILREDATGNKRLVAYVVGNDVRPSESELRRHVQQHLPEYMVPAEFVFLDAMPLTPNGKVNRRALAARKIEATAESASVNEQNTAKDPFQAQLVEIWEELLGREPIGIRDNFFELGGHSLLAARLMHRIKQLTGKTLPLAALLEAPTIEKLAGVLAGDFSRHWSSLVAMQAEGAKPPFFMVHGVGGNVVGFHELARKMKPEHPFYGLQSRGLDGKQPLRSAIEEMAAAYVNEIRTVQAHGPYHVGGFSMGGLVAYEMAQQLTASGEEVALVVLFDTYAENPKPVKLMDLVRNPGRVQFAHLPEEIRRKIRRTMIARATPEYLKKVMRTNAHAAEQYRLRPYAGKVALLRAGDGWLIQDDPYAKWTELAGELETIAIGGFHMDILREPQVGHLAECLKGCMERASVAELADSR